MSGMTAFTCRYENRRIIHTVPEKYTDVVNAVTFFVQSISENRDDKSEKMQESIYYLCLRKNTVIFIIGSDMNIKGYIYESDQILDSWRTADDMICRLISDVSPEDAGFIIKPGKAADAFSAFRSRYRNVYSPQPFCITFSDDGSVHIRDISRRHEEDDDPYNSFMRGSPGQICIEYKEISDSGKEEDRPLIICRPPEVKKKSFFQMLKGKKEEAPDLRDLLYLRYEEKEIPLNSFTEAYTVSTDSGKVLYRLDKIKEYTEQI